MKKFLKHLVTSLVVILCFPLVVGCQPKEQEEIPTTKLVSGNMLNNSTSPFVKWEGRYEYKDASGGEPAQVALYFTATGFTIDFYGTFLKVNFIKNGEKDIYYNFALDGEELPNAISERRFYLPSEETNTTVTLVSRLEEKHHTVKCLKMDEPRDAYTAISSFETDGGFYTRDAQKDNQKTKFMFVCASGGSGYGALSYSTKSNITRTTKNSSSLHSFNYLTARMFDADVQYVAQAGWGVSIPKKSVYQVLDYSGITTSNTVNGAKTTALWDYNKYFPDVILFNIGGNDTDNTSTFNLANYKTDVVAMVKKLHEKYPNAKMLWIHTDSNAGAYALSALGAEGITTAGYLKPAIINKVGKDGTYGANNHFSFKSHIVAAETIANTLQTYFGLTKVKDNVTFEQFTDLIEMN